MTAVRQGTQRHRLRDRGADLYETPELATRALLRAESLATSWCGSLPPGGARSSACSRRLATLSSQPISSLTPVPTPESIRPSTS